MENKKGIGLLGLILLCLAVSALFGIAYAAFNQNLTIGSGTANISATKWRIAWSAISQNSGSVTMTGLPASISSTEGTTSISSWSATLSKPGDYVEFNITAKNFGDYDGKLTDIKYGSTSILSALTNGTQSSLIGSSKLITCAQTTGGVAADATNVCNGLTFSVKKGSNNISSSNVSTLSTGDTEVYTIKLLYSQDSSDTSGATLPGHDVTVTVGQMDFIYTQQ